MELVAYSCYISKVRNGLWVKTLVLIIFCCCDNPSVWGVKEIPSVWNPKCVIDMSWPCQDQNFRSVDNWQSLFSMRGSEEWKSLRTDVDNVCRKDSPYLFLYRCLLPEDSYLQRLLLQAWANPAFVYLYAIALLSIHLFKIILRPYLTVYTKHTELLEYCNVSIR